MQIGRRRFRRRRVCVSSGLLSVHYAKDVRTDRRAHTHCTMTLHLSTALERYKNRRTLRLGLHNRAEQPSEDYN